MDVWFRVQCFMPPNSLGFVPIDGAICRLDVSARGFAAAWRSVPLSFFRKDGCRMKNGEREHVDVE